MKTTFIYFLDFFSSLSAGKNGFGLMFSPIHLGVVENGKSFFLGGDLGKKSKRVLCMQMLIYDTDTLKLHILEYPVDT